MAEGFLKHFKPQWEVFSAGTEPASAVSRRAISVMKEIDIDISKNTPKHVDQFITQPFDYVITVCDHANETCPVFIGTVKKRIHRGFPDPTKATGSVEDVLKEFRSVRDAIGSTLKHFTENPVDF
jgi:arsenate reductase (thioredoxin)